MGVTGLWKLIEPCGTPVPVETLEGKILAVDISIWLHQVVKGFQDSKGSALAHAHLLGLFHRLCKLLYYRVKPVFVFDGCVPQLKRDTIARRQQQRSKLNNEANRIQALLLEQLAKEQVVQQALGSAANGLVVSKRTATKTTKEIDDLYKLPELSSTSHNSQSDEESDLNETNCTSTDSSFEESNARRCYNANLQAIDVRSEHFRSLPADMRYDILVDIKETRKQSSWGRLHELPSHRDEFSIFQMSRLLKRRAVQESLEETEKEMGGRSLTYAELQTYFTEEGLLPAAAIEEASRQIASDENTRFLLVRDLKKQLHDKSALKEQTSTKTEEVKQEQEQKQQEQEKLKTNEIGKDFDADLQLAMAMSLEDNEAKVYDEKDYDFDSGERLKLNRTQRQQLQGAAKGPARGYMIEYSGFNADDVEHILEKTQLNGMEDEQIPETSKTYALGKDFDADLQLAMAMSLKENEKKVCDEKDDNNSERLKFNNAQLQGEAKGPARGYAGLNAVDVENTGKKTPIREMKKVDKEEEKPIENKELTKVIAENVEKVVEIMDSDTDSDADLIEVGMEENNKESHEAKPLEVIVNLEQAASLQDDLFADVFGVSEAATNASIATEKSTEIAENPKTTDAKSAILEMLRQQLADAQTIDLNKVEVSNAIAIELSDEETKETNMSQKTPIKIKNEIIEICDEDTKKPSTNSPKTPQRNKSITDYYEADYTIKRTPEQSAEKQEQTSNVKSPFFRNKTPKRDSTSSTKNTPSKAAKSLFTEVDKDQEAAIALKEQKSAEELRSMASDLAQERRNLENERNRQDRMGMSITQRMNNECQELLRLFGIPYIVAPMEAEAQCAFLDELKLTHGTITDDSDIWLFGGRTVYKNFFAQNKHVLKFSADDIEHQFKCNRQTLVQLACLVGSDYTCGVHGIGAVTALEILSSFAAVRGTQGNERNLTLVLDTLQRFRDWWQASKTSAVVPGSSMRLALLKKLKNIEMHEGFPSAAVIEAYLKPTVDESRTAFSWGQLDVVSIQEFARTNFGWTTSKTNDILRPVLKRLAEKRSQTTINNYFFARNALAVRQLKVSKRVQGAIARLAAGPKASPTEEQVPEKKSRKTNNKRAATRQRQKKSDEAPAPEMDVEPCTSQQAVQRASGSKQSEIIPQREKDLEEMRKKREKAAEILKASAVPQKKKRITKKIAK